MKHMHKSLVPNPVQCLCPTKRAPGSRECHQWEQPIGCGEVPGGKYKMLGDKDGNGLSPYSPATAGETAQTGALTHLWPCYCFSQTAIRRGGLLVLAVEEFFASLSPPVCLSLK